MLKIIFLICFSFQSILCIAPAQEPNLDIEPPPAPAEETMEYEQIKNKLLTNLFFRGELADKIIEANLHNTLIKFSGEETYSDVRTELIKWIGQHPDEAARLFLHLKSGTGDFLFDKMPTHIIRIELNPVFLGLVKDLITASKDTSLTNEELSMASKRLFEGMPYVDDSVIMTDQTTGQKKSSYTGFFFPDYADFKIDKKTMDREHELISNMFEQVKLNLETDRQSLNQSNLPRTGDALSGEGVYENSNILAKRENLFKQTFQMYQNFLITLSSLKGRKNITKKESDLIEKERHLLRKNFALGHALSRIYELNLQYDVLLKNPLGRGNHPPEAEDGIRKGCLGSDFQNILAELLNLKLLFMEYVSSLERTRMQLPQIYTKLRSIEKSLFNWTVKFIIYDKFVRMKMSIENMNFSCVLDRMISDYLMKFFPMSNYAKTRNEILKFSGILDSSIKKISAGNFENAFNPMAKDVFTEQSLPNFEKIMNINAKIQVVSDFSKFNKNIQFVFWDMFFNPFKIKYEHHPEQSPLKISNFSIELKTLSYP